jgi:hypothetical protein
VVSVATKIKKSKPDGLRWSDLYHYRVTYTDAGDKHVLLVQTADRLELGSIVEDKGLLIRITTFAAPPYRGVITPLLGEII